MENDLINFVDLILRKLQLYISNNLKISMDYQLFEINEEQISNFLNTNINITIPNELKESSIKRRVEFIAGRICAKNAMISHGETNVIQPSIDASKSPHWPYNIVGSISHTKNIAIAMVCHKSVYSGIGVDIEGIADSNTVRLITHKVVTTRELDVLKDTNLTQRELFTIIFSCKEALFKAIFPQINQYFGFYCVQLSFREVNYHQILSKQFTYYRKALA